MWCVVTHRHAHSIEIHSPGPALKRRDGEEREHGFADVVEMKVVVVPRPVHYRRPIDIVVLVRDVRTAAPVTKHSLNKQLGDKQLFLYLHAILLRHFRRVVALEELALFNKCYSLVYKDTFSLVFFAPYLEELHSDDGEHELEQTGNEHDVADGFHRHDDALHDVLGEIKRNIT